MTYYVVYLLIGISIWSFGSPEMVRMVRATTSNNLDFSYQILSAVVSCAVLWPLIVATIIRDKGK